MRMDVQKWKARLMAAMTQQGVVTRLLAAWATFALVNSGMGGHYWELSFLQETSFLRMAGITAAFFLLYTAVALLCGGCRSDSFFLLGAATACVANWLLSYRLAGTEPLVMLAILAAYLFFVFYFLRVNGDLLARWTPGGRTVLILAALFGVICCTVIATVTCLRYKTYNAPNYDFGLFCNMFHYMRETGLPLVTSERDTLLSHFAVHISPIYYVLLPFYYIFPSPITLQIGQAVVLASGVIPVVLLSCRLKLSGKMTAVFAFLYAFFPAITTGCYFDIHENCFLAPLLLWMFYFFELKKYLPMYLMAVAVLAVKEDAAVYLLVFALYLLLGRRKYVHGAAMGAGALGYFVLALYLLNTYGQGAMITRFDNLIFNPEDGLLGAVKTVLMNPGYLLTQLFTATDGSWGKILYLLQMLLPLGLLPFCTKKPSRWLLLTPILLNLVTNYSYQYNIGMQYQFGITAFLIYAAMLNAGEMKGPSKRNLTVIAVVACACMYVFTALPNFAGYIQNWNNYKDTYRQMDAILDELPEDASLSVSTFLLAHVADREVVYEIYYHDDEPDVDYVVFDTRFGVDTQMRRQIRAYERNGYEIVAEYDGMITIMKRVE